MAACNGRGRSPEKRPAATEVAAAHVATSRFSKPLRSAFCTYSIEVPCPARRCDCSMGYTERYWYLACCRFRGR